MYAFDVLLDCTTHDLRWDSIQYDSTQRIFEEYGENIMWTWPIVDITIARMEEAQDYRSSWSDRTVNTMTTNDGERINSYPENNLGGLLQVSHWIHAMAVIGILRFVTQTHFDMYSEKQATAEIVTCVE